MQEFLPKKNVDAFTKINFFLLMINCTIAKSYKRPIIAYKMKPLCSKTDRDEKSQQP